VVVLGLVLGQAQALLLAPLLVRLLEVLRLLFLALWLVQKVLEWALLLALRVT
jgi:hypothetical protein